jgi:5-methylcytosine-specific restriction endonuclease McrA
VKPKYPSQHPDVVRARNKVYREKNAEKLRAYDRERYAERYAARKLKGRTEQEKVRGRLRTAEWRQKNPERMRESARRWAAANPNYIAPSAQNRDSVNAKWRAMYKRNAEHHRTKASEKRARKAGVPGTHTQEEWLALLTFFRFSCAYCGAGGKMTRDHVRPLSRPELNPSNSISNILPACGRCNSQKRDKADWEFRRWLYDRGGMECSPTG